MNTNPNEAKKGMKIADICFAAVLFLFPFLHVSTGIDVADVGYNLLNFVTFPDMNKTWAVSTLLANVTGKIFTVLPGGNTMLGMNIYCTLLSGIFVVIFYFFLRKYYSAPAVFAGLLTAVGFSWCPRVILYHYLSYYLFAIGAILLLTAIEKKKTALYPVAGAVLALNTFVRFPNVVECLLIVVLFIYGILEKKHIIKEFLLCVAGYLAVYASGVALISLIFGIHSYPEMISSLFGMTSEATSYTPKSMLNTIFGDYKTYVKPFLPFIGLAALGGTVLFFVKKRIGKIVTILVMGLLFGVIMRVLYYYGIFNFNYMDYRSIYMWGVFILMMAAVIAVSGLFIKTRPMKRKLLGVAVVSIILITPIGSNNGLYTALNNLFLAAPFVIGELTDGILPLLFGKEPGNEKKSERVLLSFRAVGLMIGTTALVCGILFGIVFTFRDASFVSGDYAVITEIPRLKGMRTEASQAKELENLYSYLEKNDLNHKSAVSYGFLPGLMYFYEDTPALSHSWPGLDSFPKGELRSDLENIKNSGELPVFFYAASYEDLTQCDISGIENEKQKMFAEFLQQTGYEEVIRGDRFVLCLPRE